MKVPSIEYFLIGLLIGVSQLLPGISGSTIALIFGIYEECIHYFYKLIQISKQLFTGKNMKELGDQIFSLFKNKITIVLLGIVISIILSINIIRYLVENYSTYIYTIFALLILIGIYKPWSLITKKDSKIFGIILFTTLFFSLLFAFFNINTVNSEPHVLFLLIGGIATSISFLLPGISGSFVLLIFGLYEYVLYLASNLIPFSLSLNELLNIFIFIVGLILGFVFFIVILQKALKKFPNKLYAFLIGLMLASIVLLLT